MTASGKVPVPLLRRLSTLLHDIFHPFLLVLNRFFSLLIPEHWSRHTLDRILNEVDEAKRDAMVRTYIESEIAKMNTTSVTGRPLLFSHVSR